MDDEGQIKRTGLAPDTVAAAAVELLDEVGLDGLTVRRLAAELGVRSPALYWHFRDKRELLDLMAQHLQSPREAPGPRDSEGWSAWVTRRARERRHLLLSRRDGARLVVGARSGPAAARAFDAELTVLVGFGFTPVEAMRSIISIGHFVTGFVMEEQGAQGGRHKDDPGTAEDRPRGRGTETPSASNADTPMLSAAIAEGGPPESDEAFEQGLRLLVDGMAVLLRDTKGRPLRQNAPGPE
ncbi:TetR family transcriptional regulator [Murinocardiopsis flavida]|uniref:TetR family transcriptional regulator n=1 Tax=Murinocardiopsis flavida TaxID=645275 RepID=A0A2P8DEM8_9ACTN|nr:TetR/AcrR family transcriptional regulator C-terminal domain-containing protein [Murinocardiopsis flavida]PSK95637.1 TetR family transcriptional regulator [Murinocardiopsis flavida]